MPSLFCFSKTEALILIFQYVFTGALLLCKKWYYVWEQLCGAFVLGCVLLHLEKLDSLISRGSSDCPGPQFSPQAHDLSQAGPLSMGTLPWLVLTLRKACPSSLQSGCHDGHGWGQSMAFSCQWR